MANKVLAKLLADTRKDNAKLKEANTDLLSRLNEVEVELIEARDKIKHQEQLFIKALETNSPKNKVKVNGFAAPVSNKIQVINTQKGQKNYKQDMKTMIHQKYIK